MNDKIEVGEYVRLDRNQGINKIVDITWDGLYELDEIIGDEYGDETYIIGDEDIVKHSKNIIDIIEVGDYVNGMLVTEISKNHKVINICFYNGLYANNLTLVEADIKSIATKEQFSNIEYNI